MAFSLHEKHPCATSNAFFFRFYLEIVVIIRLHFPIHYTNLAESDFPKEINLKTLQAMMLIKLQRETICNPLDVEWTAGVVVDVDVAVLHLEIVGLFTFHVRYAGGRADRCRFRQHESAQ